MTATVYTRVCRLENIEKALRLIKTKSKTDVNSARTRRTITMACADVRLWLVHRRCLPRARRRWDPLTQQCIHSRLCHFCAHDLANSHTAYAVYDLQQSRLHFDPPFELLDLLRP